MSYVTSGGNNYEVIIPGVGSGKLGEVQKHLKQSPHPNAIINRPSYFSEKGILSKKSSEGLYDRLSEDLSEYRNGKKIRRKAFKEKTALKAVEQLLGKYKLKTSEGDDLKAVYPGKGIGLPSKDRIQILYNHPRLRKLINIKRNTLYVHPKDREKFIEDFKKTREYKEFAALHEAYERKNPINIASSRETDDAPFEYLKHGDGKFILGVSYQWPPKIGSLMCIYELLRQKNKGDEWLGNYLMLLRAASEKNGNGKCGIGAEIMGKTVDTAVIKDFFSSVKIRDIRRWFLKKRRTEKELTKQAEGMKIFIEAEYSNVFDMLKKDRGQERRKYTSWKDTILPGLEYRSTTKKRSEDELFDGGDA